MNQTKCVSCQSTKTNFQCGLCHDPLCKNCVQFNDSTEYSFLPVLTKYLACETSCQACYGQHILPEINNYQEAMEKAKDIQVFSKKQVIETRFIKRLEDPIVINDCNDHDELILRMAFQAVLRGFNGIIDMVITSTKVKVGKYQTTKWSGSAIPANINEERLIKDRSQWQNPN